MKAALINLNGGGPALMIDEVAQPSHLCLMAETTYTPSPASGYGYGEFQATNLVSYTAFDRHLEGSNFASLDGHMKWLKKETALIPNATNNAILFYEN